MQTLGDGILKLLGLWGFYASVMAYCSLLTSFMLCTKTFSMPRQITNNKNPLILRSNININCIEAKSRKKEGPIITVNTYADLNMSLNCSLHFIISFIFLYK